MSELHNAPERGPAPKLARRPVTVSHTLTAEVAQWIRQFAFYNRLSESAVLEYSLQLLLDSDDADRLAERMREAGCGLRRKISE